ncbi:MAG: MMPL family transporter, partial [Lentimicrobiaceae bacterium]|nr:MMPL family transporter [Lentimicrobiaceae bacterium]
LGIWGATKVNYEFNQIGIFKPYTPIRKSFEKIMEVNKGSLPVFAVIKSQDNILSPENAASVLGFEKKLIDEGYAGNAMSYYDYVMMAIKNISGSDAQYPADPTTMFVVNMAIKNIAGDRMDYLYNKQANSARIIIFPSDLANKNLSDIQSEGEQLQKGSGLNVIITGVQYLMKDLNENMARNQGLTLLVAFALIFISLLVSIRSFMPAFLSLIPIGITVVILNGFLGWTGISLNLITSTIFSIAIGVGIDYAVHYTSVWMTFKREGHSSAEANDFAFSYTARPIITNALGLSIGLTALMLSPLTIHMHVSILMWVSMITSVFVSLALLPIMLGRLK